MAFQMPMVIDQSLRRLASLVHDSELGDISYAKDELMRLKSVLSSTQDLATGKMQSLNSWSYWISRLRDDVYDASDLLDLLSTKDLEIKLNKNIFPLKLIRFLCKYPSQIRQMKIIRRRLGDTVMHAPHMSSYDIYGPKSLVVDPKSYSERYPIVPKSDIVGREEDKEWVISQLMRPFNHEIKGIDVIPIIGKGGMGKTTLALMVFNDENIKDHFYWRLWVCVYHKFDLKTVIRKIIWYVTYKSSKGNMHSTYLSHIKLRELQDKLRDLLSREARCKRVLLVLDDLWIENCDQWGILMELLSECSVRSKIIVTTWSKNVAYVTGAKEEHLLGALSAHDSWSLFARKVFIEQGEEEAYPELVKLGMYSIVPKCIGNPLCIETLAGSLHLERDHQSWKRIAEIELEVTDKITYPVIDMCFNQLPYNLKACFAYCSLFEKGSLFRRSELIRLWSAEGLLQSAEQAESIEDAGHKCFDELILRSFFQIPRIDDMSCQFSSARTVEWVEMHDLLHDLAVSVVQGEEMAKVNSISHDVPATVRHIVWESEGLTVKEFPLRLKQANRARTFVLRHPMGSVSKSFLEGLLSSLKLLRVLMLSGSMFEELPDLIGDLKLLRLLALDLNTILRKLPDSTCNLVNLQTLDFRHCNQLERLPRNMRKLISLWNLSLTFNLRCFPDDALRGWMSLERLHIVACPALESLGEDFGCLKKLRVLKISLCDKLVSLPDSMKSLTNIEELKIYRCKQLDIARWEGLHGLRKLRHLAFLGLPQTLNFPDGIDTAATSLQCLKVISCESLERLPKGLQRCTSLLKLELCGCKNLRALPSGLHALKKLRELKIIRCPELIARFEGDEGIDWPFISQIPSVSLDFKLKSASMDVTRNVGTKNQYTNTDPSLVPKMQSQGIELEGDAKDKGNLIFQATTIDELQHFSISSSRTINSPKEMGETAKSSGAVETLMEDMKDSIKIFSLLPNDYEFEKETLLQLWMAGRTIAVEDEGGPLITSLVENKYIWCSGANFATGIDQYRVDIEKINSHLDQKYDTEMFYLKWGNENHGTLPNYGVQHVSLLCDDIDAAEVFLNLEKCRKLKTLLFTHNYGCRVTDIPYKLFLFLKELQILDLSNTQIKNLPSSLRCLTHLRFLDLSWTPIEQLPEVICSLNELQTLKLKGCSNLRRLPKDMKMLTALRNLELDVLHQLASMPVEIGALTNLRILSAFLVGTKDGCKILELKNLNNLTGSFCIARLENVRSENEAEGADLSSKVHLKELELRWTAPELMNVDEQKNVDVLARLEPPSSLEELKILCYNGSELPKWTGDPKFAKLVRVTFFRCEKVVQLPPVERLPLLKHLSLVKMNGIRTIHCQVSEDQVAFPALEELSIIEMTSLETWVWEQPEETDFSLGELIINDCPMLNLLKFPHLSSLKCFETRGCPMLEEYLSGEKIEFITDEKEDSDEDYYTSTDESEAQQQNEIHEHQNTY